MHLAEIKESFLMALGALVAHKLRSALTLLGVLVGVFSIIVVMTAMRVLQQNIERELSGLGSQTFQVQKWPGAYFGGPEGFEKFWRRPQLTLAHGHQVQERATLARHVGIERNFWAGEASSRYDKSPPGVPLHGVTPGTFPARNWTVAEGRQLTEADVDGAHTVCVLGAGLARTLFPFGSPLGDSVKLDGINYNVVGVLESRGASLGSDQDNFAVMPLTTGLNRYGSVGHSVSILVQARDAASYDDTVEQVRGLLRALRKVTPGQEDDFEIFSNDSLIAQFASFTATVRTREIGIRRAVGARKRNIIMQFILEAVVLCEIGGAIGVVLGILAGNATALFLKVPPTIPFDWIAVGLLLCSLVGIIFGTYPAVRAANLDPIESLRYE
jgi:putative ABC transport system permease protein